MIAQRRPGATCSADGTSLARLPDSYLRLLADAGIIFPSLRDAALQQPLRLQDGLPPPRPDLVHPKAVSALRTQLSTLLDVPRTYDLEAETSLDGEAQALATRVLAGLRTPAAAKETG